MKNYVLYCFRMCNVNIYVARVHIQNLWTSHPYIRTFSGNRIMYWACKALHNIHGIIFENLICNPFFSMVMICQRGWWRQREEQDGISKGKAKRKEGEQEEKKDFDERAFGGRRAKPSKISGKWPCLALSKKRKPETKTKTPKNNKVRKG